jgi:hypothetical protein
MLQLRVLPSEKRWPPPRRRGGGWLADRLWSIGPKPKLFPEPSAQTQTRANPSVERRTMAVDLDFVHSATKRYAPANASSRLDLSVGATADAESFFVPSTYQVRGEAGWLMGVGRTVERLFHFVCHVLDLASLVAIFRSISSS